jgi:membrane protease YdiL (CAAX protease family)
MPAMSRSLLIAVLGVLAAIAVTTTMDASGYAAASALALFPLFVFFWFVQRMSRAEIGLTWGRSWGYFIALSQPILVMGLIAGAACFAGSVDSGTMNWSKIGTNFALVAISTILVVIVTEEGFFRGWLWASLERTGMSRDKTLLWTSVAFALWHVSAVVLPTGFNPPPAQIPIFLINAALLGAAWGMLRVLSGSVIISSVAHGVWNGGAYVLFGFGSHAGALGVQNTAFYGPEVGVLGLALNALFAMLLWRYWLRRDRQAIGDGVLLEKRAQIGS